MLPEAKEPSARTDRGSLTEWLLIATGMAFLPAGIGIGIVAHGLLGEPVGSAALLLHPYSILVAGAAALLAKKDVRLDGWGIRFAAICTAGLAVGAVVAAVTSQLIAEVFWRYLWFGVLSILVGYVVSAHPAREVAVKAFLIGFSIWAAAALALYAGAAYTIMDARPDSRLATAYAEDQWDVMLLSMLRPHDELLQLVWYDDFIGNTNKVANGCVLALLLLVWVREKSAITAGMAGAIYLPIGLLLLVTFSVGAFLVLAAITVGITVAWIRCGPRGWPRAPEMAYVLILMLAPALASISTESFRNHWKEEGSIATRVEYAQGAVISSLSSASSERETSDDYIGAVLLGMGPGAYGVQIAGRPEASTHNLYLDVWKDAGLLGASALIVLLAVPLWMGCRAFTAGQLDLGHTCALAGIASIAALGFREYALCYLFVTALGGFFIGTFVALAIEESVY